VWLVSFKPHLTHSRGKVSRYSLSEPHSWSGCLEKSWNVFPLPRNELQYFSPYPSLYMLFRLPVCWTNTRMCHLIRHKTPTFCVLEFLAAAQPLSIAGHTVTPVVQGRSLRCPHSQNWNPNLHTQAFFDSNASSPSPAAHVREWYGTCRRHNVIWLFS